MKYKDRPVRINQPFIATVVCKKQRIKTIFILFFNAVLRRCVAWIRSSLLVKIQWQKHHYIAEHGCGSVRDLKSHDHNDVKSGSMSRGRDEDINQGSETLCMNIYNILTFQKLLNSSSHKIHFIQKEFLKFS
jgi:hypothetical protein